MCHYSGSATVPCLVELCVEFAEDVAVDIIDAIFQKNWPSHLILTLCNLVCDLLPYLSAQHLIIYKVSCLYSFVPICWMGVCIHVVALHSHSFHLIV